MKIAGDTHTHTVACNHAYSTLRENAEAAAAAGHQFVCITEHTEGIPGCPPYMFFSNLPNSGPRICHGVIVVRGAEVNVLDTAGTLVLEERVMKKLDLIIAGIHRYCYDKGEGTQADFTRTWLNVAHNSIVDIIAHVGNKDFAPDFEAVVREFVKYDKIVEINNHTPTSRKGSEENCREVVRLCRQYGAKVCVSGDAHYCEEIGHYDWALSLLEAVDYPEELVVNSSYERFRAELEHRKGVLLPDALR